MFLQSYLDYCGGTGRTGWFSAFEEPGSTAGQSNACTIFSHDAELVLVALSEVGDTMSKLCDGSLGGNFHPSQTLLLSPFQDVLFDLVAPIRPWSSPTHSDAVSSHMGSIWGTRGIRYS